MSLNRKQNPHSSITVSTYWILLGQAPSHT